MRVPVELRAAYRLINHGPTTLISSAHDGAVNVMAAAWVMALDLDPPRLAVVIDGKTRTRALVDASGEFVVQLPTAAMADLTWSVGSVSGADLDKLGTYGVVTEPASLVGAPLVVGCAAWLECVVEPEPVMQDRYDLFAARVVAAWADDELWRAGEWHFSDPLRRTIHHTARGVFFATGERVPATRR